MNSSQKEIIAGVTITLVVTALLFAGWKVWGKFGSESADMHIAPEYVDLTLPDEAMRQEVTARLALRQIFVEAIDEGQVLRVHTNNPNDLAFIKGFLGHDGYQVLMTDGVGNSRFERRLKYTIALERELERTLSMIEGVAQVSLHIAMTEPKLMGSAEKRSVSAFIVADRASRRSHIVRSVRSIVSDAIAELDPQRIEVVFSDDGKGEGAGEYPLASVYLDDPMFEAKVAYENYYANKIKTLLSGLNLDSVSQVTVNVILQDKHIVSRESRPLQGGDKGPVVAESHTTEQGVSGKGGNASTEKRRFVTGSREVTINHDQRSVQRVDVAIVIGRHMPSSMVQSIDELLSNAIGIDALGETGMAGSVNILAMERHDWGVTARHSQRASQQIPQQSAQYAAADHAERRQALSASATVSSQSPVSQSTGVKSAEANNANEELIELFPEVELVDEPAVRDQGSVAQSEATGSENANSMADDESISNDDQARFTVPTSVKAQTARNDVQGGVTMVESNLIVAPTIAEVD